MIPNKQTLDGEAIRAKVEAVLSAELGLNTVGYKCDRALVINVLVAVALQGGLNLARLTPGAIIKSVIHHS